MILKLIYTLFLGVLLAAFVGMGISAFYPQPPAPEYPAPHVENLPAVGTVPAPETAEEKQTRIEFDQKQKDYQTVRQTHNRNVSLIALAASIIILAIGLAFANKLQDIADGVLLGGVFTLLYGIGIGFDGGDDKYRFLLVSAGLVIGFVLGYMKFIKPSATAKQA